MENFDDLIQKAIDYIDENKLPEAEDCIRNAAAQNISAPQTHNLYGIIAEYKGDILLAVKHYRASYALEPSYKPALRNLERITDFYGALDKKIDFGNETDSAQNGAYTVEYDSSGIGRVKKK